MSQLQPCSRCHRHVAPAAAACPFCGQVGKLHVPVPLQRLAIGGMVAVGTVTGCPAYGGPMPPVTPTPMPAASGTPRAPLAIVAAEGTTSVAVRKLLHLSLAGGGKASWRIADGDEARARIDENGVLVALQPGEASVLAFDELGDKAVLNVTILAE